MITSEKFDNIYKNYNNWYFTVEIEEQRARVNWIFRDAFSAWHYESNKDLDLKKSSLLNWVKNTCEDTGFHKDEIEAFKLYLKL